MNFKLINIMMGLGLYLLSTGISFAAFNLSQPPSGDINSPIINVSPGQKPKFKVDPSVPRDQECPLNGVMYTKQESDIYEKRRPLAVMIENSAESRPQSGLSRADIVYEAIAEGWITRMMGLFYCNTPMENIIFAPVRSARIYFTKIVPEYDALYNHVGGAGNCDDSTVDEKAKALCFVRRNKIKDLDQFGRAGDFRTCHRVTNRLDHDVAYEHTMACYTEELYKVAEKLKWTNVDEKKVPWDKNFTPWKFKTESDAGSRGSTTDISFDFWSSKTDYSVSWKYDPNTNRYSRSVGNQPALDLNTGESMTAKNVVIQFVKETGPLDEHLHMYYEVVGTGKTLVFQDGKVLTGTWSKTSFTGRTRFFDDKKKEIQFNPGQIWIELVPSANQINYN